MTKYAEALELLSEGNLEVYVKTSEVTGSHRRLPKKYQKIVKEALALADRHEKHCAEMKELLSKEPQEEV